MIAQFPMKVYQRLNIDKPPVVWWLGPGIRTAGAMQMARSQWPAWKQRESNGWKWKWGSESFHVIQPYNILIIYKYVLYIYRETYRGVYMYIYIYMYVYIYVNILDSTGLFVVTAAPCLSRQVACNGKNNFPLSKNWNIAKLSQETAISMWLRAITAIMRWNMYIKSKYTSWSSQFITYHHHHHLASFHRVVTVDRWFSIWYCLQGMSAL